MRLRSFTGATLVEARNLVRQELGDDAEVTSTKDLGGDGYQITCVLPEIPEDDRQDYGDFSKQSFQALRWHRTPLALSRRLAGLVKEPSSLEEGLRHALNTGFTIGDVDDCCKAGQLVMLVGPPGVGKTVTAVKLAVRALLRGIDIALLSCDHIRQGGATQLQGYAERLQCKYYLAPTARIPFLSLLSRLQHEGTLVIADTTACNPFLRDDLLQLTRMASPEQLKKYLVLSSIIDRQSAILMATSFKPVGISGLIGTGVDYEIRMGSLFAAADQLSCPLICWSQSSRVNDPLHAATAQTMAQQIVRVTPQTAYQTEEDAPPDVVVQLQHDKASPPPQEEESKQDTFSAGQQAEERKSKSPHARLEQYDFQDIPLANNLITIGSGKGGVGKTWFSITLAQAMARLNRRVLLFDADLGLANVDIQLGLTPEKDLGGVVQGRLSLREAITTYSQGNFDVVAGRSGSGSLSTATPGQIHAILADLVRIGSSYDHVLLDLGAGIDPIVRLFSYYGRIVLLLTTEDPTSIADTYAFIKILHAKRERSNMRVVMNLVESPNSGMRSYQILQKAAAKFLGLDVPLAGIIQRDRSVIDAIRHQSALLSRSPVSPAARTVVEIATDLVRGKMQPDLDNSDIEKEISNFA